MRLHRLGINIVMNFEGFRSRPYLCQAGKPTIGYGSRRYKNGRKVSLNDPQITQEAAYDLLLHHMDKCAEDVRNCLEYDLNDYKFSALVSFVYNIGITNFKTSSVLRMVNKNADNPFLRERFLRWNKVTIDGKKVFSQGLYNRRLAEADLFFKEFIN